MLVRSRNRLAATTVLHESACWTGVCRLLEADLASLRRGETARLRIGSGELCRMVIDTLPLDDPLGHALCDLDHTAKPPLS